MKNKKVIVVGLDGATFDVMMPWIKRGKLPNIQKLMEEGCYGNLESTIHPLSPQAWSSFITGKNPGKHGIFDFTWRRPYSYEVQLTNASYREGKSLWKILGEHEKMVGVINVPMTYPPEKVNGFMISGMDAPGTKSNFTYPPELYDEIIGRFGEYIIGQRLWEYSRRDRERDLITALKEMTRLRTEVTLYLMDRKKWDFLMVVYRASDIVQHRFWKYYDVNHPEYSKEGAAMFGSAIFEIYSDLDSALGRLLERVDENCSVIVLSDHGAGGFSDKSVYLNSWLESEGLLAYLDKSDRSKGSFNHRLEQHLLWAKSNLARYVPHKLKMDLQRFLPGLFNKMASLSYFSNIDWSKTKAYSEEVRTNIWINVKGREPDGIVEPGSEYENLRNEIIRRLSALKDGDTTVFEKVYKREELYKGKFLEHAPDLVLLQDQSKYELTPRSSLLAKERRPIRVPSLEERKNDIRPTCGHRMNGILIARGKHVKKNAKIHRANIIDLAPTMLYLMGHPINSDMDGKVIEEVFIDDFLKNNEIVYKDEPSEDQSAEKVLTVYDKEEQEIIEENLKGLGYL